MGDVPAVDFMCLVLTHIPGERVIVGDTVLCCCVYVMSFYSSEHYIPLYSWGNGTLKKCSIIMNMIIIKLMLVD